MSRLLFYLIVKPLSFLPLAVLYVVSDFVSFAFYFLIGFRKKVVLTNMRNAFPEKPEREIKRLARKFYRHFTDVIVETIRLFSMSKEELLRRMRVVNPELLDPFFEQKRSVFLAAGHYNNWELAAIGLTAQVRHRAAAIYAPLANPFFDRKMKESRGRFGLVLIPKKEASAFFARPSEPPFIMVMGTDQSPTFNRNVHWTTFLNQETAVMLGTEKYSQRLNAPVVFGFIRKPARGMYELTFHLVEDQPPKTHHGVITEKHTRLLEEEILEAPEYWLWTHKRWKRKKVTK